MKKIIIAIALIAAVIGVQVLAAQENNYTAYVYNQMIPEGQITDGSNITINYAVAYIPVSGSGTYTFTSTRLTTLIDMSQPTKINSQIANTTKEHGITKGYNVVKVFVPSYEQKIP